MLDRRDGLMEIAVPDQPPPSFARSGFAVLPRFVDESTAAYFWTYIHTLFVSMRLHDHDNQVKNALAKYGDPAFDTLLEHLRPGVERASGLRLLPTYSYFRLYKTGDMLEAHRDRPACEISVTLNLGQIPEEPWPIWIEGADGPVSVALGRGDALLYRGIEHAHWREAYAGRRLAQVFLHYVDADGAHRDEKFDRRKSLGRERPPGKVSIKPGIEAK